MTSIGTVIAGKYEVLKEIGRGGMSIVYLANDTHLNKLWAVKEVKKKGSGKNDEIVVNSLLAEANMVKRLDHAALPRIVDIIDNGTTIYIVMDFIEGESLDKILNEFGAQPEEKVIGWAMQVCDVFSYLHSQKPPIIYRDMKPANLMLKPNGNISIIDFGIAREYKEQNLADTTVLGTKGYAPPEQYSGQTDPRSDIFALGMTMHHLLTGVDPRSGEPYAPVRNWNPELSEAVEIIIDKCVQPAAEKRYQSAAELLVDLDLALKDPGAFTKKRQKQLKLKRASFFAALGFAILAAIAGVVLNFSATQVNNSDYDSLVNQSDISSYYDAIEIYPDRIDAYSKVIDYNKNHDSSLSNDDITKIGNKIEKYAGKLNAADAETANLYYEMGKLYFAYYDGAFKTKAANAKNFFAVASGFEGSFDKKNIASCYYSICNFMTSQTRTAEHTLSDYNNLFDEIETAMNTVKNANDSEANYDKLTLYYSVLMLIQDQSQYMAGVGFDEDEALSIMEEAYNSANAVTSSNDVAISIQTKIQNSYSQFVQKVKDNYSEVAKRQNGGK